MVWVLADSENFKGGSSLGVLSFEFLFLVIHLLLLLLIKVYSIYAGK
jgi:hypothetical protein